MILNNYIYQATSIWPSPHSWNDQGCVSQKHCELPACIFCIMSPLVNTPDSDNLLVRSELCALTVYWLTWSLHSVYFSLLPEQGKSVDVYFTSDHSFMDFCCATDTWTSVTSYTSVNIYNLNSRLTHFVFEWNIYVHFELESWRNILWCSLHRALTFE